MKALPILAVMLLVGGCVETTPREVDPAEYYEAELARDPGPEVQYMVANPIIGTYAARVFLSMAEETCGDTGIWRVGLYEDRLALHSLKALEGGCLTATLSDLFAKESGERPEFFVSREPGVIYIGEVADEAD